MPSLLIHGGRIVDPSQGLDGPGDLLIEDGAVARIDGKITKPKGAETLDATGLVVTPGLIDIHVHLREPGQEYKETVRTGTRAAAAGGFIGIAHPSWSQLTIEDGEAIAVAHAVEIYNHGCAVENDRGEGWYLLDQLLNKGRRLNAFATDDAHFRHGDFDAFGGWVQVKAQSLDPDAVLEALKAGHFYSSQGPVIHELSVTGKEVTISCSPVNAITIMGGTSRTVTRVGRHITGGTFDLDKLSDTWLPGGETAWIRIAIIDAAGRRAWSNPIWRDEV